MRFRSLPVRLLKIFLPLCALTALLCLCTASAENALPVAEDCTELFQCGGLPEVSLPVALFSSGEASFSDYVGAQLESCAESFSVSAYRLTPDDFRSLYGELLNSRPDLFYVQAGWKYSYNSAGYVVTVWPYYKYAADELPGRIAAFQSSLQAIVGHASAASTTLGKLMLINDYFCVNFDYDDTLSRFGADELFSGGTGVCQAFMLGYRAVLNELGVVSSTVSSDAMNHTWNIVQLDGEWYHIDVTWNDTDYPLLARHNYFLMSDAGFASAGHYSWSSPVGADSALYDNAFWHNLYTPVSVNGNDFYYVAAGPSDDMRTLMQWRQGAASVALHTYSIADDDGAWWSYAGYDGVSCNGERLYYGAAQRLYSVPVDGGTPRMEYEDSDASMTVWQLYLEGGALRFFVASTPVAEGTVHTLTVGHVRSLAMLPASLELVAGESAQLTAVLIPDSGSVALLWSSSDESVVTVDENGLVTAVAPGTAQIIAACENPEATVSAPVLIHHETRLILPAGTRHILNGAFADTAVAEIVLPEGIVSVGEAAFSGCEGLEFAVLPGSLTDIADDAFGDGKPLIICPADSPAEEYAAAHGFEWIVWPAP